MIPNDKKKSPTVHDGDGLFIPSRQLSLLTGGMLALVFFVFLGGYFLGKNTIVEPYMVRIEQAAFADQIYAAVCARYDQDNGDVPEQPVQENMVASSDVSDQHIEVPLIMAPEPVPSVPSGKSWYAPLIGYGKEQSALAFADKLQQKGIGAHVKKYASKTSKGTVRHWYQVVTELHTDRGALQTVVDKVAHEEKIKNIKIIEIA